MSFCWWVGEKLIIKDSRCWPYNSHSGRRRRERRPCLCIESPDLWDGKCAISSDKILGEMRERYGEKESLKVIWGGGVRDARVVVLRSENRTGYIRLIAIKFRIICKGGSRRDYVSQTYFFLLPLTGCCCCCHQLYSSISLSSCHKFVRSVVPCCRVLSISILNRLPLYINSCVQKLLTNFKCVRFIEGENFANVYVYFIVLMDWWPYRSCCFVSSGGGWVRIEKGMNRTDRRGKLMPFPYGAATHRRKGPLWWKGVGI